MYGKDSIGFMLVHIGREMRNFATARFETYGITPEQWGILHQVEQSGGVSQVELARQSNRDQAGITRLLDQLERQGWVERRANPADRRSFLIHCTERGKTQCRVLEGAEREMNAAVLRDMGDQEVVRLMRELQRIAAGIQACRGRGGLGEKDGRHG